MDLASIAPPLTDRAFLVGSTGSGKTYLARHLLRLYRYVVVHDAKGLIRWPGYARYTTLRGVVRSEAERIIYAPSPPELLDPRVQDSFFAWVYERGNTVLYTDEVYAVSFRGEWLPSFRAVLTRGRERGITSLNSAQRPTWVPLFILSEAEHYYVFRLTLLSDRKRIQEVVPLEDPRKLLLPRRWFWYSNVVEQTVIGPITLKKEVKNGSTSTTASRAV